MTKMWMQRCIISGTVLPQKYSFLSHYGVVVALNNRPQTGFTFYQFSIKML